MQKTLSAMGNSLALVIDKPIRKLLGIGRHTLLEVRTDGRRIVIEPVERVPVSNEADPLGIDEPSALMLELSAAAVFDELLKRYKIDQDRFRKLHHNSYRLLAYVGWINRGGPRNADADELMTMRRLHACHGQLRAGRSWDEAMESALERYPCPSVS